MDNVGDEVAKKAAEVSQNNETKLYDPLGFIVLQTQWFSLPAFEVNKSFLILIKAKYFCYITNLLLSKFVRSRWLLGVLWTETKSWSIKTPKKELGQHGTILTSRLVKNVPSVQYLGFAILPKTSS